jgi:hypothetical protein
MKLVLCHSVVPLSLALAAVGCSGAPSRNSSTQQQQVDQDYASSLISSWTQIALDAVWRDATPPAPGETRSWNEEAGPTRASRALAIVNIAVYDAVQSIVGTYNTYTNMPYDSQASMSAAVAVAAHDTLSSLFPSQKPSFDLALQNDLAANHSDLLQQGIDRGTAAAANILGLRTNDGSQVPDPLYTDLNLPTGPGQWAPDVLGNNPKAVGGYWMNVTPFALSSASQFRAPPPNSLDSPEYQADFNDVINKGSDGVTTPTTRTDDETVAGIFWGYDGAPKIGTPPRLYNMVALTIARDQGLLHQPDELTHLLAAVNTALADAAICAWDSKFFYNRWRPDNAIRSSANGNPTWMPLGAMESNTTSPDFTPPFPSYPSGHSTFGGALFQVLLRLVGDTSFTFVSDEFNGVTTDSSGNPRPLLPRTFNSLEDAQTENARSRVLLGVHWQQDEDNGVAMGNQIGDYVVDNLFARRNDSNVASKQ